MTARPESSLLKRAPHPASKYTSCLGRARLLLADDHPVLLAGLKKLLEDEFDVVGMAADGIELIASAQKLRPDAAIVDISMPRLNGIDAIRRIRKVAPHTRVLVLSVHSDSAYVKEALRAGARGYILKQSAAVELITGLHQVLRGRIYLTPPLRRDAPLGTSKLTLRQLEVLKLVAEGCQNKEIAAHLHISTKTVEFHKTRIMSELDIHTPAGLTRYAIARGILGN